MTSPADGRGRIEVGGRMLLGFYLLLSLVALIPVFAFPIVPLGDMPNHLARVHILTQLATDPDLQRYYATDWQPFGFQSLEVVLVPLAPLIGLVAAQHLYVAASFLLMIAGTAALHHAFFRRVGLWPAAAVLFLYNLPLMNGQVSFLFTLGLGLLCFAAWIEPEGPGGRAKGGRLGSVLRLIAFSLAHLMLMLFHFFAFACYVLTIMAFAADRARTEPDLRRKLWRVGEAALPFAASFVLFLTGYQSSVHGATEWGSFAAKPVLLMDALVTYASASDIVLIVVIGGGLWLLERRKLLRFAKEMRANILILILAAVAMPHVLTGVVGADIRLPCWIALLLVAATDIRWPSRRTAALYAAAIAALLLIRVGTIWPIWQTYNADYAELRAADSVIARGSRVIVFPYDAARGIRPGQPKTGYPFMACLVVIDRDVFLPHLYTFATPLRFLPTAMPVLPGLAQGKAAPWQPKDPAFAAADAATVQAASAVAQRVAAGDTVYTSTLDWSAWPEHFDYAIDLGGAGNPVPALLTEVGRGSFFTIYRIHPPQPVQ